MTDDDALRISRLKDARVVIPPREQSDGEERARVVIPPQPKPKETTNKSEAGTKNRPKGE